MIQVGLITIGAELLNGTRVDTNAAWIGDAVISVGGRVVWHLTVDDEKTAILNALDQIPENVKVVLTTGGLGPTHDDITPAVLYKYFQATPEFDEAYWQEITEKFALRGKLIPESNRNQAYRPDKGEVIPNPVGTARGLHFAHSTYHLFAMPGVPAEMKAMMNSTVLPWIEGCSDHRVAVTVLRTTGIMESALYEQLEPILKDFPNIELAFLPKITGVDLRIKANDSSTLDSFIHQITPEISKYHYGNGTEELEDQTGELLRKKHLTIATAESCTGGLIGDRITNTPGSSDYMRGGVVAYSNEIKTAVLGVKESTLEAVGAVSRETAAEMAAGVRTLMQTDLGLSTTGIAGPTGGTKEKPVGLVYVGLADHKNVKTWKFRFAFDRKANKLLTSQVALNQLRRYLLNA
jgi:nicotinamide-nucleotide amidase